MKDQLDSLTNPSDYVGRSPEQVDEFIDGVVIPEVGEITSVEMDEIIN